MLVGFVVGHGNAHSADVPPEGATIPIVHTWGDLLATTPITVESDFAIPGGSATSPPGKQIFVKVHLGIDRDQAASFGGVVIYCLSERVSFWSTSFQLLGPFVLSGEEIGAKQPYLQTVRSNFSRAFGDSRYFLYSGALQPRGPGKYRVSLFAHNGVYGPTAKPVAVRIVTVTGAPRMPWSPWGESKKEDMRWKGDLGTIRGMTETYTSMTVSNPNGRIGIPQTNTIFIPQKLPTPGTQLPRLTAEKPDPETHLEKKGNDLVVKMNHEVAIYYPDDHFLTRWWVNDKAFVPDPDAAESNVSTIRSLAARVWNVKEVHFELDFRPERLDAKKGDKIGLQLLFCPAGWGISINVSVDPTTPPPPPAFYSYASNRIDFIYSGDPNHP